MENKFQKGDWVLLNKEALCVNIELSMNQRSKDLKKIGDLNNGKHKHILGDNLIGYVSGKNKTYPVVILDGKHLTVFDIQWFKKEDTNRNNMIFGSITPENCLLPHIPKPIREKEENQIIPLNLDL